TSWASGEDVVQDAAVRTLEYLAAGGDVASANASLWRQVNNLAIDNLRRDATAEKYRERLPIAQPDDYETAIELAEIDRAVRLVAREDPERYRRYREAWDLFNAGYSHEEIGGRYGCS